MYSKLLETLTPEAVSALPVGSGDEQAIAFSPSEGRLVRVDVKAKADAAVAEHDVDPAAHDAAGRISQLAQLFASVNAESDPVDSATTIAVSATSDASLTSLYNLQTDGWSDACVTVQAVHGYLDDYTPGYHWPVVNQIPNTNYGMGAGIMFYTDAPVVEIQNYGSNQMWVCAAQNWQKPNNFTQLTNDTMSYAKLTFGNTNLKRVYYGFRQKNRFMAVRCAPPYRIFAGPRLPRAFMFGDSTTGGAGSTYNIDGWAHQLSRMLRMNCITNAKDGTGYIHDGGVSYPTYIQRLAPMAALGTPKFVTFTTTVNDTLYSLTAQRTAARACWEEARRLWPNIPIIVQGRIGESTDSTALAQETEHLEEFNSWASTQRGPVFFIPVASVGLYTLANRSLYNSDGVGAATNHPNSAGYDMMIRYFVRAMRDSVGMS